VLGAVVPYSGFSHDASSMNHEPASKFLCLANIMEENGVKFVIGLKNYSHSKLIIT
jgi:hypothetical protein